MTIDLKDVTEEKIDLTAEKLTFTGKAMGGDTYSCELEFIKEVDPEKSTYKVSPAKVAFLIMKKVEEEEHWPRLLKDKKLEKTNVKIDWSKYVDEDEENGGFDTDETAGGMGMGGGMPGMGGGMPGMGGGMGGMDMAQMQQMMAGMGGAGGMGGMGGLGDLAGMGGMGGEDLGDLGGDADSDDEEDLPDLDGGDDDDAENVD